MLSQSHRTIRSLVAMPLLGALFFSLTIIAESVSPESAAAISTDTVGAYASPPLTQGPPSSVTNIETFDSAEFCGALPYTRANFGTFSGNCTSYNGQNAGSPWGGATTTSDTPTFGGTASYFVAASAVNTLTVTFSQAARYVGFWWSAGSGGNTVKFYTAASSTTPIATFTTTKINTILGSTIPNPYPGSGVVTAINGTTYNKGHYWGRPRDHTSIEPTTLPSSNTSRETHAYLNVFANGSIQFTKVEFSGAGFEFDNLAIADAIQTPSASMVFVENLGKTVTFLPNDGTGTVNPQTSIGATTLTANSFTRPGYTFAGWHTTISGTGGTSYADQISYDFSADLTLYAKWTPDPFTVTYNSQGGSAVSNGSTTVGVPISDSPGVPTQSGYTFLGWFTAISGGTAITFPYTHGQTANFTLYAQWSPVATPVETSTTTLPQVADGAGSSPPSISAPRTVRTGTLITVVARGFVPGESVEMSVGENRKKRTMVADNKGEVRLKVTLTTASDGTKVVARASAGSRVASQTITVTDSPAALPETGKSSTGSLQVAALLLLVGALMVVRRRPVRTTR